MSTKLRQLLELTGTEFDRAIEAYIDRDTAVTDDERGQFLADLRARPDLARALGERLAASESPLRSRLLARALGHLSPDTATGAIANITSPADSESFELITPEGSIAVAGHGAFTGALAKCAALFRERAARTVEELLAASSAFNRALATLLEPIDWRAEAAARGLAPRLGHFGARDGWKKIERHEDAAEWAPALAPYLDSIEVTLAPFDPEERLSNPMQPESTYWAISTKACVRVTSKSTLALSNYILVLRVREHSPRKKKADARAKNMDVLGLARALTMERQGYTADFEFFAPTNPLERARLPLSRFKWALVPLS
jgi:hypothetical protein